MKKYKYKIEVWFRHGNFEKDFEQIDIYADDDQEAIDLARDYRRWVFKTEIIRRDEV